MMNSFVDYAENLRKVGINQKNLIYVLFAILFCFAMTMSYMAMHRAHYLVPYNLTDKVSVSVNRMTPKYLISLALADAAAYFDIDRNNVGAQTQLFLSRIHPELSSQLAVKLQQRRIKIEAADMAQVFYPGRYFVDAAEHKIIVNGNLLQWTAGKLLTRRHIELQVGYRSVNGYLFIQSWKYKNA